MEGAVHQDWSGLPEDLIAIVMRALDIPDLLHAGEVCTSWRAAFSAVRRVRIPMKDASPCLLYSCAGNDADTATIYSPSAGAAFKIRQLPGPAFRSRYVLGLAHGWIVAADEASNLQALNPLTGAQVDLPPVTGLHHVESSSDDQGRPVYVLLDQVMRADEFPDIYTPRELRRYLYHRVYLSCSPSAGGECVVLLMHKRNGDMSFARVGDDRWTLVTRSETVPWDCCYRSAAFNDKDGLFYVLSSDCSIYAFDLKGPKPVARKIIEGAAPALWEDPASYIVLAPWGDILHVWRYTTLRTRTTPVQVPAVYAHEVIDPYQECYTDEIKLYKVDVRDRRLVEISSSDLQGHALFLGFNSSMLVPTKDFPRLKPNCAYMTDDAWEQICVNMYGSRDVGI